LRFKVRGSEGTWIKQGLDPQEAELAKGLKPGEHWGTESAAAWGTLHGENSSRKIESEAGAYTEYYRLLAEALLDGAEPPVKAEEARDVIYGLELCRESFEKRCWVEWVDDATRGE